MGVQEMGSVTIFQYQSLSHHHTFKSILNQITSMRPWHTHHYSLSEIDELDPLVVPIDHPVRKDQLYNNMAGREYLWFIGNLNACPKFISGFISQKLLAYNSSSILLVREIEICHELMIRTMFVFTVKRNWDWRLYNRKLRSLIFIEVLYMFIICCRTRHVSNDGRRRYSEVRYSKHWTIFSSSESF